MRKYATIILLLIVLTSHCSKNQNPLGYSNDHLYYPVKVGNTWYYDVFSSEKNPWIKRIVQSKIEKNENEYFIIAEFWGENKQSSHADTIRLDKQGRIWKYIKNGDYLWFDFSLKDGETYKFKGYSKNKDEDYLVTVKKGKSINTKTGYLKNCIEFFFDIPKYHDDEVFYVFAPNVGLVKTTYGEGPELLLSSAKVLP